MSENIIKRTGIIRRIDDLGRVVVPKELRDRLRIHAGDPVELCLTPDGVVLVPYRAHQDCVRLLDEVERTVRENREIYAPEDADKIETLTSDLRTTLENYKGRLDPHRN